MGPQNSLHLLPGYRKLQNTNEQQLPILAHFQFAKMKKVTNTLTSYISATFLIIFFVIFDQFCVKVGFNC